MNRGRAISAYILKAAALALLLVDCSTVDDGAKDTAVSDDVAKDSADDALDSGVDVPTADVQSADTPVDAAAPIPDAPDGANLHIRLNGPAHLAGAVVEVVLAEADLVQAGLYALGPEHAVLKAPVASFPTDLFTTAPAGDWVVRAIALGGNEEWMAVGLSCTDGGAIAQVNIAEGGGLKSIHATLKQDEGIESFDQVCGGQPDTFLRPTVEVATPPVENATAHYMAGVVHGERYWLAAYQDGVSSFHFPPGKEIDEEGLAGWTISGGAFCSRILRHGDLLFCGTRTPVVQVHAVSVDSGKAKGSKTVDLGEGHHSEGMTAQGGRVWVAVHDGGLRALADSGAFGQQSVKSPAGLTDAWDVAAVGSERLLVADGVAGVAMLSSGGAAKDAPAVLHTLKLPGTSAFLAVSGPQAAVSALGGGLHIIRWDDGGKMKLQGSWSGGGLVYGLSIDEGHVFAGVGSHVLALKLPGVGSNAPPTLRALQPSPFFALDADPYGKDLLTAEFQGVRILQRHADAKQKTALVMEPSIFAPLAAVGAKMRSTLTLRNVSDQAVKVSSVRWYEAAASGSAGLPISGPVTVPGNGRVSIAVEVDKTIKGAVAHGLLIQSDDGLRPVAGVRMIEVDQLQPGDKLPAMTYQDKAGKSVDVGAALAGKVGVLLIAAETCPVAFYALASAKRVLAPWLASGKVAAVALNPWNQPIDAPETDALQPGFPVLYTPLTTSDGHDWSEVLDVTLGQPSHHGPPMPIVYVVDNTGVITLARWGWRPDEVEAAIQASLPK